MTVEPPTDEAYSVTQVDVQPRNYEQLRQELAFVLDKSPAEADEWINQHNEPSAEEKIRNYWL
jgi:hypothetical protein